MTERLTIKTFDNRLEVITDALIEHFNAARLVFVKALEQLVEEVEDNPDITEQYVKFAVSSAVTRIERAMQE